MERLLPDRRYHTDPQFRTLVDTLRIQIEAGHYTPTELREACHLAACMYEYEHIRPILVDPRQPFEWNIAPSQKTT